MLSLALGGALLLTPAGPEPLPQGAGRFPFVWDQGDRWRGLERRFVAARLRGCEAVESEVEKSFFAIRQQLAALRSSRATPDDERLAAIESGLFELAPMLGACTARIPAFVSLFGDVRTAVKEASLEWDLDSRPARDTLYRLLYGGRLAVEELLLQLPVEEMPTLTPGTDEPSRSPGAEHRGVRVHSGDILVSRGGAPTSALIARGNDYPGNFSHVALLHLDEVSGEPTIIESHIEEGVVLSSLDAYLRGTKLRIMVLRLRADLPALVADPTLPHQAATLALRGAEGGRIPYDFEMDYRDHSKQFCSEVASAAYGALGIDLWQGLTSMSSRGVTTWLAALGVRYFETHGPADLEYDPQLRVVAEWRDAETLFQDHLDNAVIDVLLEGAELREELRYDWRLLPYARLGKAYSALLNRLGRVGPVPEGMSATVALRVRWLRGRHSQVRDRAAELAERFAAEAGYTPPYWVLVELARRAKAEIDAKTA